MQDASKVMSSLGRAFKIASAAKQQVRIGQQWRECSPALKSFQEVARRRYESAGRWVD